MNPSKSLFLSLSSLCNGGSHEELFGNGPFLIVSYEMELPSGVKADVIRLPSLTNYQTEYLKQRLNIQKDGPMILVSNGLLNKEYLIVGESDKSHTDNGESLAKNLADVIAVSIVSSAGEDDVSLQAMEWVRGKMASLRAAIDTPTSSPENMDLFSKYKFIVQEAKDKATKPRYTYDDSSTVLYSLPSDRMSMGFILNKPKNPYEVDPNLFTGAEIESGRQYCIYSYNIKHRKQINRTWRRYPSIYKHFDWFDEEYCSVEDYSTEGVCLGKIIEEEINASIVQLIRKVRFDIEMPRYWRRYDDTKHDTCVIKTKNLQVTFNFIDKKRNILRTVPIGQVYRSIETLLAEDEKYESALGIFASSDFIRALTGFSYFRNDSTHPGGVSAEDFQEMHQRFTELMESYMHEIVRLKERLKS